MTVEFDYRDLNRNFGLSGNTEILLGKECISQAIYNIFSTAPGEAGPIFEPQFGSLLYQLLYEPADDITAVRIRAASIQALQRWEPRIIVDLRQSSIVYNEINQSYDISIVYTIRATGQSATSNLRLRRVPESTSAPFSTLEKIISLRTLGWPGTYEFCRVNEVGDLAFSGGGGTWGDQNAWFSFNSWSSGPSGTFRYTTLVDNGFDTPRVVNTLFTTAAPDNQIAVEISTGNRLDSMSSFRPISSDPIFDRYVYFRISIQGSSPILQVGDLFFYI